MGTTWRRPYQIRQLVDYVKKKSITKPPYAKIILSMGASFPEQLKLDAKKYLKSNIIESWGNTEGLGTITTTQDLQLRPSSIGKPFLTDNLMIVDLKGKKVKPNTVGRIAGKVDSKFSSYIKMKNLNKELIKGDLIISEDLGLEDEKGYFFLYGRESEVIKTRYGNIYPIILEKIISYMKEVDEVAILGISKGSFEIPVCVIKPKSYNIDLNKFLLKINSNFSKEQQIKKIKTISEFTKTASNKIKKSELKYLFNK